MGFCLMGPVTTPPILTVPQVSVPRELPMLLTALPLLVAVTVPLLMVMLPHAPPQMLPMPALSPLPLAASDPVPWIVSVLPDGTLTPTLPDPVTLFAPTRLSVALPAQMMPAAVDRPDRAPIVALESVTVAPLAMRTQ